MKAVAYSAMQPCQPVTRSNLAECVYIAEQAVTTVCGFRMIYDDGSLFPLLQTFANGQLGTAVASNIIGTRLEMRLKPKLCLQLARTH